MPEINLLIFDWDGTLMDSETQIVQCMQAAIADLAMETRTPEQIKNIIGLGLREAITSLFPDSDADLPQRMSDAYRTHWLSRAEEAPLFPGVEETLHTLHEGGYRLAVATGKGRVGLDKVLNHTGLGPLFHATRCSDETRSKPHPQMLQEIHAQLAIDPRQSVMIGDTEYDMEMAQRAGAHPIAVSYGVHDKQRLLTHQPVACLDKINELLNWLAEPGAVTQTRTTTAL